MLLNEITADWKQTLKDTKTVTTSKGLPVTLVLQQRYDPPGEYEEYFGGAVKAFVGDREVGYLPFGYGSGTTVQVGDLDVSPGYRRKGIASAMFNFVRKHGVPLEHYPDASDMTAAGRAFANSNP